MVKPTELLKDLSMFRIKFDNVRGKISRDSTTFHKREPANLPASKLLLGYCIAKSWL